MNSKRNRKPTDVIACILLTMHMPLLAGNPAEGGSRTEVNDSLLLARTMSATGHPDRDTVILRFIGDVMLHKAQIENASMPDGTYDFSGYFTGIEDEIAGADIAVANMEFTLAGEPHTGYPAFSAPDSYAEYMADCGIDLFLTANNHILDKGEKGLLRTLAVYSDIEKRKGARMTGSAADKSGTGRNFPLYIAAGGLRLAFINFTYGTNTGFGKKYPGTYLEDRDEINAAVESAKRLEADFIIALPHWGDEYELRHSGKQKDMAVWLASAGVDLIVGTHPHVVQDTEVIEVADEDGSTRRVPVIYSLGNAISNMSAPNTQIGLMYEVRLVSDGFGDVESFSQNFTFLWTSLPGRLSDTHTTVKVKDYIGKRDAWRQKYEYDKMVSAYCNVKRQTGIED